MFICYNGLMRILLLSAILFLSACSAQPAAAELTPASQTPPPFATATLPPTATPRPSATAAIPTIAPTIAPVSALLTTQVNVRAAPDKSAAVLGLLGYGARVQVIGKDAAGQFWQIIYPENSTTTAWVAMAYAQMAEADAQVIPVVAARSPAAPTAPAVPVATGTSAAPTNTARVKAQIFVRSGPATTFADKGTINAGTIVTLLGRVQNNVWVQIKFDGGMDGKGWVAGAYLEAANFQGLPYFDNQGLPISTGNGTPNPPAGGPGQPVLTVTAYSPAAPDGDSEKNPAVKIVFSPDSAREFTYSSELSSPSGDGTDWVAFTPYEPTNQSTFVYFKLECSGNGAITATLELDGRPVPDSKTLVCGNYNLAMKVLGGTQYTLVLNADGTGSALRYVSYTLHIRSQP
jgi:uncharacterized protein YraI